MFLYKEYAVSAANATTPAPATLTVDAPLDSLRPLVVLRGEELVLRGDELAELFERDLRCDRRLPFFCRPINLPMPSTSATAIRLEPAYTLISSVSVWNSLRMSLLSMSREKV